MSEDLAARLSRWSQRKLAVRRGVAVDDEAEGQVGAPSPQETPEAHGAEEAVALHRETATADAAQAPEQEEPALPPVDELTADSDYTVFMAKKVPEAIRRAALRKLWLSDPVFANLDRLNDYDEDYSIAETLMSVVRTSYQVGKGYIDDVEKEMAEREPANDERTRRTAASEAREATAESADAGAAARPDVAGDDADGDETAVALRPMGGEPRLARHRPVEDMG